MITKLVGRSNVLMIIFIYVPTYKIPIKSIDSIYAK
jgi:hypothetical protein